MEDSCSQSEEADINTAINTGRNTRNRGKALMTLGKRRRISDEI